VRAAPTGPKWPGNLALAVVGTGAIVLAAVGVTALRREPPPLPAPVVSHGDQGWEVRWSSPAAGRGRVEVFQGPGTASDLFDEPPAPATADHRVRFRLWPRPGLRLRYRVRVGQEAPGEERPLEVPGDRTCLDRDVEAGATRVRVTFRTRAALAATLSAGSGGPTTREAAACQSHVLSLDGLAPGTQVPLVLASDGGQVLERWSQRLPAPNDIFLRMERELERTADTKLTAELVRDHLTGGATKGGSPAVLAQWRSRCRQLYESGDFTRALAAFREVKHLLPETDEIDPGARAKLLRRISDFMDLREILDGGLGITLAATAADLLGAGSAVEPSIPPGLETLWSLVIGRRAPSPATEPPAPRVLAIDGPDRFLRDVSTMVSPSASARAQTWVPGPLATGSPVRRAWLGFRIRDGGWLEKLGLRIGPDGKRGYPTAYLWGPGKGQVAEGFVRIDERLLADRTAGLTIAHEFRFPSRMPVGIVLERLVLVGDRGRPAAPTTSAPQPAAPATSRRRP
jgi:hypothetical protein